MKLDIYQRITMWVCGTLDPKLNLFNCKTKKTKSKKIKKKK